jgi:hypothetical protein
VHQKSNFFSFFAMSQFDWPIAKKIETMDAPQNKGFYGKMECLPVQHTYIKNTPGGTH